MSNFETSDEGSHSAEWSPITRSYFDSGSLLHVKRAARGRANCPLSTHTHPEATMSDPLLRGRVLAPALVALSLAACMATAPVAIPKSEFPNITPVGSAVPKQCAALLGGWAGTWPYGNFGQLRLWVTDIDASCTATYTYSGRNGIDKIVDGTLRVPCGGGTCSFSPSGDGLSASYSESATQRANFGRIVAAP